MISIEDKWQEFENGFLKIAKDAPDEFVSLMHDTFFFGAGVLLHMVREIAEKDIDPVSMVVIFEGLNDEFNAFLVEKSGDENQDN